MDSINTNTNYIAPTLYIVMCSVERGFLGSDVEAPDFENENEL